MDVYILGASGPKKKADAASKENTIRAPDREET